MEDRWIGGGEDSQGGFFHWKLEDSPRKIGRLEGEVRKTGGWRKAHGGLIDMRLEDSPWMIDGLE